ncbi:hypothetical protein [Streptomyces griseorubiginosus]|nr:hypothetical protein [Streptomyces griseorubiginosus]
MSAFRSLPKRGEGPVVNEAGHLPPPKRLFDPMLPSGDSAETCTG